ncbi:hypothetical protein J5N97_016907 [Dioscorea zingiberensis]|uniref:Uncharacterized protein n=1 Tax=Dioscorea zingiberensis TaxID=325984 RepID=A0A9D5HG36_9LILI|nr:hypothetical protein J5N97_016907 [Dioscorea zingiberensis]
MHTLYKRHGNSGMLGFRFQKIPEMIKMSTDVLVGLPDAILIPSSLPRINDIGFSSLNSSFKDIIACRKALLDFWKSKNKSSAIVEGDGAISCAY